MIETLTDKEPALPTSQTESAAPDLAPTTVFPSESAQSRARLRHAMRLALGVGVILAWTLASLRSTSNVLTIPPAVFPPLERQVAFMPVLNRARTYCPPQARVLMLNNGSAADQLTDYFIYPRQKDLIELDNPFSAADLDSHMGGCLIYYGQRAGQRLDPFRSRLKEIVCSGEGCLYGIER